MPHEWPASPATAGSRSCACRAARAARSATRRRPRRDRTTAGPAPPVQPRQMTCSRLLSPSAPRSRSAVEPHRAHRCRMPCFRRSWPIQRRRRTPDPSTAPTAPTATARPRPRADRPRPYGPDRCRPSATCGMRRRAVPAPRPRRRRTPPPGPTGSPVGESATPRRQAVRPIAPAGRVARHRQPRPPPPQGVPAIDQFPLRHVRRVVCSRTQCPLAGGRVGGPRRCGRPWRREPRCRIGVDIEHRPQRGPVWRDRVADDPPLPLPDQVVVELEQVPGVLPQPHVDHLGEFRPGQVPAGHPARREALTSSPEPRVALGHSAPTFHPGRGSPGRTTTIRSPSDSLPRAAPVCPWRCPISVVALAMVITWGRSPQSRSRWRAR